MHKILTITDLDATGENLSFPETFKRRSAARAVINDSDGKTALLYIAKGHYHKLPGGGVEEGEDLLAALEREVVEEIGCHITVDGEIGTIEEYRARMALLQTSYCYHATVEGGKGEPAFTEEEIAEGASMLWADSLTAAIELLENDQPNEWEGHFIVKRDLVFLKAAQA